MLLDSCRPATTWGAKPDRMPTGHVMPDPKPPASEPPIPAASGGPAAEAPRKALTPAAERALAEAAARRAERDKQAANRPGEVKAPQGPDPVRYGDWEHKGIASDF